MKSHGVCIILKFDTIMASISDDLYAIYGTDQNVDQNWKNCKCNVCCFYIKHDFIEREKNCFVHHRLKLQMKTERSLMLSRGTGNHFVASKTSIFRHHFSTSTMIFSISSSIKICFKSFNAFIEEFKITNSVAKSGAVGR